MNTVSGSRERRAVLPALPARRLNRVKGKLYVSRDGVPCMWSGTQILCPCGKRKSRCRKCGGNAYCACGIRKERCRQCDTGGGSICKCGKRRSRCTACSGGSICPCGKRKDRCKSCHPDKYLLHTLRNRMHRAIKRGPSITKLENSRDSFAKHSITQYIGCSAARLRDHLQSLFKEGMTFDNYGDWHIDHIRPCASFNLSLESDRHACFHFSNLQPLWKLENLHKGSRWPASMQ